jgi:hypothetical protein
MPHYIKFQQSVALVNRFVRRGSLGRVRHDRVAAPP